MASRWNRVRGVAVTAYAAVREPLTVPDPFADVQRATRLHRRRHRCGAYAYADGALPATVAAAVGARRIVEVGTALGYTALSMAHAVPGARVDTIEADPDHVRLARGETDRYDCGARIEVLPGRAEQILPTLEAGAYDLALFDGFTPTLPLVHALGRLLRVGGTLLVGNLVLGPPAEVTDHLADPVHWRTCPLGETAWCVRQS
ncbi:class I SAM-dependent methyltransferase [Streptomyces sp. NPDC002057]|uniref:O-methyltransferase n=1 Tax=Streptomyces sp. NPDC002057 TaxID=3154664 RepID=UPI00332D24A4